MGINQHHRSGECSDGDAPEPYFARPEGLRRLLDELATHGGWHHLDADQLMRYATDRYAALARKHHLEPADAVTAAFEAMRLESTRSADDPWAVVTTAVRRTLIAEERGNDLLISPDRARRPEHTTGFHDPARFGEQDHDLAEYHPALQVSATDPFHNHTDHHTNDETAADDDAARAAGETSEETDGRLESDPDRDPQAVTDAVSVLTMLGWPPKDAQMCVQFISARLADIGARKETYEALRRDKLVRAKFDIPHDSWIGLLRILLGHAPPTGTADDGLLARLMCGENVATLLFDDDLVRAVNDANPHLRRNGGASHG